MALQKSITLENGLVVHDAYHVICEEYTNKIGRVGTFILYSFKDFETRNSIRPDTPLSRIAVRQKLYEITDNGHAASNAVYEFTVTPGINITAVDSLTDEIILNITHDKETGETIESFISRLREQQPCFDCVALEEGKAQLLVKGKYSYGAGAVIQVQFSNYSGYLTVAPQDVKLSDYEQFIETAVLGTEGLNPTKSRYEWLKFRDPEFADAVDI